MNSKLAVFLIVGLDVVLNRYIIKYLFVILDDSILNFFVDNFIDWIRLFNRTGIIKRFKILQNSDMPHVGELFILIINKIF